MNRIAYRLLVITSLLAITRITAMAETRPRYGGTLRVMMQSSPNALALSANSPPNEYWDLANALSLIGDTLVTLDVQGRPQPALAIAWQSDPSAKHWQFTIRRDVKFHDGSTATPAAIAEILGPLHPSWMVRSSTDSILIDSETSMPSLLAELALPRNLVFKRNANGNPIGTGAFVLADWQPGNLLKLAASDASWSGRPFVDSIEINFGKSPHDPASALGFDRADIIEIAPVGGAAAGSSRSNIASSSISLSLPVELLALVFPANSRALDAHLRQALALAIDRKPIQSVLLKGVGDPAATILPNWMTGYTSAFPDQANPQQARALVAGSRQPPLNLSYDPRDPQAQLIAERIALNAHDVGITVQVALSGPEDIRLVRVALPSPDPATSLTEAARQLGLPASPLSSATRGDPLEDLFRTERALLADYTVVPLFHLPLSSAASARIGDWRPDQFGRWSAPAHSLADIWFIEVRPADSQPTPPFVGPR